MYWLIIMMDGEDHEESFSAEIVFGLMTSLTFSSFLLMSPRIVVIFALCCCLVVVWPFALLCVDRWCSISSSSDAAAKKKRYCRLYADPSSESGRKSLPSAHDGDNDGTRERRRTMLCKQSPFFSLFPWCSWWRCKNGTHTVHHEANRAANKQAKRRRRWVRESWHQR